MKALCSAMTRLRVITSPRWLQSPRSSATTWGATVTADPAAGVGAVGGVVAGVTGVAAPSGTHCVPSQGVTVGDLAHLRRLRGQRHPRRPSQRWPLTTWPTCGSGTHCRPSPW